MQLPDTGSVVDLRDALAAREPVPLRIDNLDQRSTALGPLLASLAAGRLHLGECRAGALRI
jgi:hypothetical protein